MFQFFIYISCLYMPFGIAGDTNAVITVLFQKFHKIRCVFKLPAYVFRVHILRNVPAKSQNIFHTNGIKLRGNGIDHLTCCSDTCEVHHHFKPVIETGSAYPFNSFFSCASACSVRNGDKIRVKLF